jgi:hypothetical protein
MRRSDPTDIPRSTDPASYDDEVENNIPSNRLGVPVAGGVPSHVPVPLCGG